MERKNIHILLVEDDDVDCEALERYIKKEHLPYDLKIAATGDDAIAALETYTFDLILLDYNLQTTTGLDLLPIIGDIPAIFVTGSGSEEIAAKAMRQGACDYLIKDPDRNYLKVLSVTIEKVLEQKKAEIAFKKSEERFRALTENTTDFTVIFDEKSRFQYCNPAITYRLGYSAKEIIGHALSDFIHPEDIKTVDKKIDEALENNRKSISLSDFRVMHKNGSCIYLTGHIIYMPDVSSVNGIVGNFQDITRRKQAEKELAGSRSELDAIIKTVPDIIYRLNPDGTISFISDAVRQYGYQPESILGTPVIDLVYQEDREKAKDRLRERRTRNRSTRSFEVRLLTKDQEKVHFEIFSVSAEGLYASKTPCQDTFIGTQGIARDITRRKQAEAEREKMIIELQEALDNVKTLSGLLPICAKCKKIRDDKGYWNDLESYIEKHSNASFSHGMCRECSDKLYGKQKWYIQMSKGKTDRDKGE